MSNKTESELPIDFKPGDYKSPLKPIWCAGCGNYAVLNALAMAFAQLKIPRHEIAVITGIGCSSRLPGYLSTYGFNTLHGRAVPIATGVKLANPKATVIAAGGDGDMFSIGGGHLAHVARRNVDLTLVVMDNRVYGLTKGQMSPTTPIDSYTSTTTYGSYEQPVNMVRFMLGYGTGFVARAFSGDMKQMAALVKQGIQHRGFSFIQALSPCVTYRGKGEYDSIKSMSAQLPDDYDPTDQLAAWQVSDDSEKIHLGLIYHNPELVPYDTKLDKLREKARGPHKQEIARLIDEFRP